MENLMHENYISSQSSLAIKEMEASNSEGTSDK